MPLSAGLHTDKVTYSSPYSTGQAFLHTGMSRGGLMPAARVGPTRSELHRWRSTPTLRQAINPSANLSNIFFKKPEMFLTKIYKTLLSTKTISASCSALGPRESPDCRALTRSGATGAPLGFNIVIANSFILASTSQHKQNAWSRRKKGCICPL